MKALRHPAVLLATILLLTLTACGTPAATPSTSSDATAAPAAASNEPTAAVPAAGNQVKIVWWHISTDDKGRANWQTLADTYTKDHPNVSIEITVLENEAFKSKLATVMQSGNPPDIFQSWGGGVLAQYAKAGLVQDITEQLKQNGWGDSFQPGPLSLYGFDGKYYGVPWSAGMVGFWYNKALFQQAGIDQPPATWTEFLGDVKKLKDAGITPIALGEKDKWPGHFYWVYLAMREGGKPAFDKAYSRSGTFADESFVAAGQRLKELIDLEPFQDGFLGATYGDQQAAIGQGKAAMELMGQWAPGGDRTLAPDPEAFDKNLGWFPFPSVEGGTGDAGDALGGGDGFGIGKNAPPEAIDFVRFLTSLDNQKAMATAGLAVPPTVKGAETVLTDPLIKDLQQRAAAAKYFQLYYDQYLPPAVGQTVNDATQSLFAGAATPEDVAKSIESVAATELK